MTSPSGNLLSALHYLHSLSICHNNITENTCYLVFDDMESNHLLKVGDLDQARSISEDDGSGGGDEVTIVCCEEDGSAHTDLEAAAFVLFRIFTLDEG